MSTWVLVLFLKYGYAGGVIYIEMPNYATCKQALADVRQMDSHRDSACVSRAKVERR